MRRRELITLFVGAGAWPLVARAQQQVMPVIGLLSSVPFDTRREQVAAFHRGLREVGYAEGQNVAIEYRSADNQVERLPTLARELVSRQVVVIVTIGGDIVAHTAKAATSTIPIVFVIGTDPVTAGFVTSLNRPGGNLTGISFLVALTGAKRLELLGELAPAATRIGWLTNPGNPNSDATTKDAQGAADILRKTLVPAKARTAGDIDAAFALFVEQQVAAVLVDADPFFLTRREQLVALTARHVLPACYPFREFPVIGGLMSYGTSLANAYRQAGVYAGKIVQGAEAADLPVVQPTKFELVINLKTATAIGLRVPLTLQVAADEVIE